MQWPMLREMCDFSPPSVELLDDVDQHSTGTTHPSPPPPFITTADGAARVAQNVARTGI